MWPCWGKCVPVDGRLGLESPYWAQSLFLDQQIKTNCNLVLQCYAPTMKKVDYDSETVSKTPVLLYKTGLGYGLFTAMGQ